MYLRKLIHGRALSHPYAVTLLLVALCAVVQFKGARSSVSGPRSA